VYIPFGEEMYVGTARGKLSFFRRILQAIRICLVLLPFAMIIFSGYWASITGGRVWRSLIGVALMSCNIVMVVLSAASCALMCFVIFEVLRPLSRLISLLYVGVTLLAFLMSCLILSYSTDHAWRHNAFKLRSYCCSSEELCPDLDLEYSDWCVTYFTAYSVKKYVRDRTSDMYVAFSGIFGPWVGIWIVFIVFHIYISQANKLADEGETTVRMDSVATSSKAKLHPGHKIPEGSGEKLLDAIRANPQNGDDYSADEA
jgi:hypothetical protein